jgi:hypothetical protein
LLKREWENTDYIAKHVIQARVLSAVGFENQYPILEMTFPVPIEVTSDLTLIGVTKGTGSLIGVGCTVYYDQVEVGNVRLLKTLN